jgi:intracellular sulfur oxidation DsrE/DsrF family protein
MTIDLSRPTARRGFLGRLAAIAALPLIGTGFTRASDKLQTPSSPSPDDVWLRTLNRKHRVAFDVEKHKDGHALIQGNDYLNDWRKSFGVPENDINLVMAVRGTGIPLVLNDALWQKFHLGEQYGITDPVTKTPGTRNLFTASNVVPGGLVDADASVEALQKRGVLFLVCHNTVEGAVGKLSKAGLGTPADVRAAILGGILPGVHVVPAMVIAFTEMEERGVGYIYAG